MKEVLQWRRDASRGAARLLTAAIVAVLATVAFSAGQTPAPRRR